MNQQKKLIVEVYRNTNLKQLIDLQNVPDGMMMVEGVLGRVDSVNRNKRFYERGEYAKHIELMQKRITESNGIFGELEHPAKMTVDLNRVSHKVMEVRLDDDNFVRGRVLLLDTPNGKIAQSIIRSGSPLPISSRAIGQVQENGSVKLDYMSTYDLVGTSGFAEASMNRKVYESLDDSGNAICESYEFDIDENGNVIEEAVQQVNENNPDATQYVHISEISRIVAEQLAAMNLTPVNEAQTITQGVSETDVIALMNERFANTYSPIIENWLTSEFAPKLGTSIQEWLVTDYSNIVESWIKEDVLPENAMLTEQWLGKSFAPALGTSIQEWLSNDYATVVESWINDKMSNTVNETVATTVTENAEPAATTAVATTINEHADLFSTSLLASIDTLINEANDIPAPVAPVSVQIDETMYGYAPKWLNGIPEEFKAIWQSMNESQKDQIYKRASVRLFESTSDVTRFWKSINLSNVIAQTPTNLKRSIQVNEELEQQQNARSAFANYAKSLRV